MIVVMGAAEMWLLIWAVIGLSVLAAFVLFPRMFH